MNHLPLSSSAGSKAQDAGLAADWLVKLLIYLTIAAVPLTIALHYRWLPNDDALRHAAKAVSGRAWTDVLVLREDAALDQHPGWHAVLTRVHQLTGGDAAFLVVLSYLGLFILFCSLPVPILRRPEAWVAALLLCTVVMPEMFIFRLMRGRPYLIAMAALTGLLLIGRAGRLSWPRLLGASLLFAWAAYMHSAWYVFVLLPAAYVLAGEGRKAGLFSACWAAGVLLGALATGHPGAYLFQQFHHALLSFGQGTVYRQLVGEFTPLYPAWPFPALLALIFLARKNITGRWPSTPHRDPILILAVIGWALGLRVYRFWADWGLPAFLLWAALEMEAMFDRLALRKAGRRALTAAVCLLFYLGATADREGIWSTQNVFYHQEGQGAGVRAVHPDSDWMPGAGGIVYADSMGVFYDWFFDHPQAPWRYVLGFEAGLMPPEDLRIYRDIQFYNFDARAFQPWISKMRPEDRLVIRHADAEKIAGLEWMPLEQGTWIGRLPAQGTPQGEPDEKP